MQIFFKFLINLALYIPITASMFSPSLRPSPSHTTGVPSLLSISSEKAQRKGFLPWISTCPSTSSCNRTSHILCNHVHVKQTIKANWGLATEAYTVPALAFKRPTWLCWFSCGIQVPSWPFYPHLHTHTSFTGLPELSLMHGCLSIWFNRLLCGSSQRTVMLAPACKHSRVSIMVSGIGALPCGDS